METLIQFQLAKRARASLTLELFDALAQTTVAYLRRAAEIIQFGHQRLLETPEGSPTLLFQELQTGSVRPVH
jgi:hypothetical protein